MRESDSYREEINPPERNILPEPERPSLAEFEQVIRNGDRLAIHDQIQRLNRFLLWTSRTRVEPGPGWIKDEQYFEDFLAALPNPDNEKFVIELFGGYSRIYVEGYGGGKIHIALSERNSSLDVQKQWAKLASGEQETL